MKTGARLRGWPPSVLRAAFTSSYGRRLSWPPGRKSQPAWPSAERPPRYARASSRPHWSGFPLSRATSGSSAHWRSRKRHRSGDVSPLLDTPEKHPTVGSGWNHTRFCEKRRAQHHRCAVKRHVVGSGQLVRGEPALRPESGGCGRVYRGTHTRGGGSRRRRLAPAVTFATLHLGALRSRGRGCSGKGTGGAPALTFGSE
jgi:hypothetical protein